MYIKIEFINFFTENQYIKNVHVFYKKNEKSKNLHTRINSIGQNDLYKKVF